MSQNAQRCPSTSLVTCADYAGVLFGARARQIRVEIIEGEDPAGRTRHAVNGEPYSSAKDTLFTSNRLPQSPARANAQDVGREALAR